MKKSIPILLLLILISCNSEIKQEPGVLAKDPPKQTPLIQSQVWERDEYFINAIAQFELKAKVLGKEHYIFDRVSDLAPYDLALGWGQMSDQTIVDKIDISQRSRWFFWNVDLYPIPRKEIEMSASNMHIISSNDEVKNQLDDIIVGEIIYLKGYLVSVMSPKDGWHWKSSLSRNDTGNGACEVVWVEKLLRLK
ncbi:MAG: hypothetical protein KKF62_04715 [Bacteroidetes bacterium]|nr:hypothetical protein [Bacteroidota bacterium]MBU1113503.1 hypothetical protein [Bacteroidota bacterium]MBU1798782.1 hypothetical protein [Bacteroidota bacterium]